MRMMISNSLDAVLADFQLTTHTLRVCTPSQVKSFICHLIESLPLAQRACSPAHETGPQLQEGRNFVQGNTGHKPEVYYNPVVFARLKAVYTAARACLALLAAAPDAKPGSSKGGSQVLWHAGDGARAKPVEACTVCQKVGTRHTISPTHTLLPSAGGFTVGAKRKEPDPVEQLLLAYPDAWDGAIPTITSLIAAIRALGQGSGVGGSGGGSHGAGGTASGLPARAASGSLNSNVSPAPSPMHRQSPAGGGAAAERGPSAMQGSIVAAAKAPSMVAGGAAASATAANNGPSAGGSIGPLATFAAATACVPTAAAMAAAAACSQATGVLTKRLQLAVEAAAIPDNPQRLVEAAFRRQLGELAEALPVCMADARLAASTNSGSGRGKHTGRHAAEAGAEGAAVTGAVHSAVARALDGIEPWLEQQRSSIGVLLDQQAAEAARHLDAALEAVDDVMQQSPTTLERRTLVEELAWRVHVVERKRMRLQLG
jgi:hypothetical protein